MMRIEWHWDRLGYATPLSPYRCRRIVGKNLIVIYIIPIIPSLPPWYNKCFRVVIGI